MLVCGINVEDKSTIIWQRNGVDLIDVDLMDGMKVELQFGIHLSFGLIKVLVFIENTTFCAA